MFVKGLIEHRAKEDPCARFAGILAAFGNDLSAQQSRVARVFALVALAGELAIAWGIFPWKKGSAQAAALVIFERWRAAQPQSAKSREHAQILKAIKDFVDTYLDSRFSNLEWTPTTNKWGEVIEPPVIRDRAGYWKDENTERIMLFTPAGLREATRQFDFGRVIQALDDANVFVKVGATQKTVTTRIVEEHRTIGLYWIDPAKLQI